MIAAGLLTLLLGVPADADAAASAWRERAPVPPEGAQEVEGRLDHPRGVERALSDIVLEHGDRARLWTYGESGAGRPLLALELHGERMGEGWRAGEGPTIFVVADLERDAAAGARDVTAWARTLVQDDAALCGARWVLLPAPTPDRLAGVLPDVALAWDFPCGWDAWATPGAGAYPLRAPETRALATGFCAWGTGAALVVLGADERRAGGSLETYARSLGWAVLGLPRVEEGDLSRAHSLIACFDLEIVSVQRSTAELWEIEVSVRPAAGSLAEGPAREDVELGDVELEVGGAALLAAARRASAGALPLRVDGVAGTVRLPPELLERPVGMSEGARVRLLVRGAEAERVHVRLAARRWAPRVAEVQLRDEGASGGD